MVRPVSPEIVEARWFPPDALPDSLQRSNGWILTNRHVVQDANEILDEGIDLVIGETFSWVGEALIALERAKATGLPVINAKQDPYPGAEERKETS